MGWHQYVIVTLVIVTFPRCSIADMKILNEVFLDKLSQMYSTNAATNSEAIRHFVADIQDSCNTDVITNPDHVISTAQLIGVCQENVTQCQHIIDEHCFDVQDLLASMMDYDDGDDGDDVIKDLKISFPTVLFHLVHKPCSLSHNESASTVTSHRKVPTWKAWLYGLLFVALICFISNVGGLLAPFQKKAFFQRIMLYCVGLAVGALAATGFLVLIPESMDLTKEDSPVPNYKFKMTTVLAGVYFFYVSELLLKLFFEGKGRKTTEEIDSEDKIKLSTNVDVMDNVTNGVMDKQEGHPHYPTKVPPDNAKRSPVIPAVALVILIGDAVHNFVDGIAIGAAFTENVYVGVSVSLAVICEELPHELGDIALLLHLGLSMKRALIYNFLAACTCFLGLVIGILVGENTDGNMWIFAVAGGMFVYISLVDMIPEMKQQANEIISKGIEGPGITLLIQNAGLVTGFVIILMLVLFGDGISLE